MKKKSQVNFRDEERVHKVYYLPKEHYIGVTSQKYVSTRVNNHRQSGLDTEGYRTLSVHKTREEARHRENLWHSWLGCNGMDVSS